jgi:peptidoglycan/LPS O-acetylase OafA/YrhL
LHRDQSLDALRGLAAFAVCLYHICFADSYMPQNSFLESFAQFGDKGVQVFFILSGLVIPWSMSFRKYEYNLVKEFLLRRFIRIQAPYAIALTFTIFCYLLFIDPSLRLNAKSILNNFLYLVPYSSDSWILNVAWTLGVEVQFYLIVAIGFPFFTYKYPSVRRFSLLALASMGLIPAPESINAWYFFPTWAPFFAVGIMVFLLRTQRFSKKEFYLSFSIILCFLFIKYTKLLSLVCLSTTAFLIYFHSFKPHVFLTFLGKISYSLYLVHLPIILMTGMILNRSNFSENFPNLSVAVLLLAAISGSTLFYILFEKPSLKWAKLLKKV